MILRVWDISRDRLCDHQLHDFSLDDLKIISIIVDDLNMGDGHRYDHVIVYSDLALAFAAHCALAAAKGAYVAVAFPAGAGPRAAAPVALLAKAVAGLALAVAVNTVVLSIRVPASHVAATVATLIFGWAWYGSGAAPAAFQAFVACVALADAEHTIVAFGHRANFITRAAVARRRAWIEF